MYSLRSLALCSLVCIPALFSSSATLAGSAIWSSTNIQYLYGDSYQSIYYDPVMDGLTSKDDTRSIITLEHVDGWKYGDNFFFVDITNPNRSKEETPTSFYGEISPRLSFGKMSGKDLSFGIIKDVLLTTTMEVGEGFHNYLYGIAVDLELPRIPVFSINYYVRNEAGTDTGNQLTLVWVAPFSIGAVDFSFEGFLDYAYGVDPSEDNLITAPRFLVDVGKFWGAPGDLQVGVEYQIWRNKYGIKDIDEDVAQAMVKWIW